MKRVNILWLLLNSLFLIVFNLLFFMFQESFTTPVWISYAFIHFSYILLLLTPTLVKPGPAAYIYSRAAYGVTVSYFLIELALGTIFIIFAPEGLLIPVISQVILAAVFIALLITNLIANEHTAANVERREEELKFVKESSAQVNSIARQITDKAAARKVEKLYDLLHGSPAHSDPSVFSLEKEIFGEIDDLEDAVSQNDLAKIETLTDKIYRLAEKRNRNLRLLNNK